MRSPISWVGGKSRVVKKLLPLIPEHVCYVEVFAGAGWLLFAKKPSKQEVLNDLDGDLMNFWSIVKNAHEEFINSFDYSLISRRTFDEYRIKYLNDEYEDCIEKAHVFYYILRTCFGSRMDGKPSFGISKTSPCRLNLNNIKDDINSAYERLKRVTIESDDCRAIIKRYDSKNTLFYLDPPYLETTGYRAGPFGYDDYCEVYSILKDLQGKFILTVNDHPALRELFKDFNKIEHEVLYSFAKTVHFRKAYEELIITNYELKL